MHLRDKLIKFFHGFTQDEMNSVLSDCSHLKATSDSWRARAEVAEEKIKVLEETISYERGRVDALEDRLVNSGPREQVPLDPIQTLPMSWTRARRKLEEIDRAKVRTKRNA